MSGTAELRPGSDGLVRCAWCVGDPLYEAYHDREWGWPVADEVRLFEKICLEGFQSGLSWLLILRKREAFRRAFAGFVPEAVARFDARRLGRLARDPGIVRHPGKIAAVVNNARRALALARECGSLAAFLWSFAPPPGRPAPRAPLPARSPESEALARALKRRGWRYVGPTTMYALMQAAGMVNDHFAGCSVRAQIQAARAAFTPPR
ncbi:MAG: 3-methyladenine DNA glycosylase [Planctomycetota bacterium]|nr:MAG: 3-methyladenine DNA glycosylase [Planctomycetota bacterium]